MSLAGAALIADDLNVPGTYLHPPFTAIGLDGRIALFGQRKNLVLLHAATAFFAPACPALVSIDLQKLADLRDKRARLADEA